jgi:hypothetical protein
MSLRTQVWDLLIAHEGEWLPRSEIEKVGGAEATRRLREIRNKAVGFDIQRHGDTYRLIRTTVWDADLTCVKCGAQPVNETQPSVDPRWRLGRCPMCGKGAIFEKGKS